MEIKEKSYGQGITLRYINTDKFKKNSLKLSFMSEREVMNVSSSKLLASTLSRGCRRYPSVKAISRELCLLYEADLALYSSNTSALTEFTVSATMLDDRYAFDGGNIFGGVIDLISELLFEPIVEDGGLNRAYFESERKRRIDMIRAEINNKDRYALSQAARHAFRGTPLGVRDTEESIGAVTAEYCYATLQRLLCSCPIYISFTGNYTEEKAAQIDRLVDRFLEARKGFQTLGAGSSTFAFTDEIPEEHVTESVNAKQGRMVLMYSVPNTKRGDCAPMIFDEIFGASPTSRLFTNVRERMSLCYYCSSTLSRLQGVMTVRSGLDRDKKDEAIAEIDRQLSLLCDPKNIGQEELENAKLSRLTNYAELTDDPSRYLSWYNSSVMGGFEDSIEELCAALEAVTAEDVACVARSVKRRLCYFLDGVQ